MTNTNSLDVEATVKQSLDLIGAGCELVRISAPSMNAAEKLKEMKARIRKAGYDTPLIADVHFNPKIAELAATLVEK